MHSVAFERLPNGLRVVTIHRRHLHRSVVAVYANVGSRHETPGTNGLSHFLEHMLFRGTRRHPTAYALNDAIERLGGTLAAATHGDYTLFNIGVPPGAVDDACALMGSIFSKPVFSQIDVEKGIVREEILEHLDDDHRQVNADNLCRLQVFGSHPLGYPITGTLENVDRFTTRDLYNHLRRYYRGGNMVVAVCSPLPHKQVLRAIERGFRALPPGPAPEAKPMSVTQQRARIQTIDCAGAQTVLRLAFPTPGDESPHARAVDVLMRVLDDGMSTRLHRRICDDLGLAYDLSAGAELFNDVGVMDVATSVAHESVARLVEEVLVTLGDLAIDGPSGAEMEKVQHRYVFDLAALDDDPHGLADFYGAPALWNRRTDLDARRREILRLTPEHVRRAARIVFAPSRLNLTMVGSVDDDVRSTIVRQIRRYRARVGHVVATTVFPSTRIRRPLTVRAGRRAAALDSLYASP